MTINKLKNYHTHEIFFGYEIESEDMTDGENLEYFDSVYFSLDDDLIKECNEELKTKQFSRHHWDDYINNILMCLDENDYEGYRFEDMVTLSWGRPIKIDRRIKENRKEVA